MPPTIVAMYTRQGNSVVVAFRNMPSGMIDELKTELDPAISDHGTPSFEYELGRIHVHERDGQSYLFMPYSEEQDTTVHTYLKGRIQQWLQEHNREVFFTDITTKAVRT